MVRTSGSSGNPHDWELELHRILPLFGHRNWIVVADAAYPAQSNPGIETVVADADHLQVLRKVQDAIAACKHVHANIYTDMELEFVEESDAPGVSEYRRQLAGLLHGSDCRQLPHEKTIATLDQCARMFRVMIVKTNLLLPYSSVFFELDCGYWTPEAEDRLRHAMLQRPVPTVG